MAHGGLVWTNASVANDASSAPTTSVQYRSAMAAWPPSTRTRKPAGISTKHPMYANSRSASNGRGQREKYVEGSPSSRRSQFISHDSTAADGAQNRMRYT